MGNELKKLKNAPSFISWASVAGKKESEGPLGTLFDICDKSDRFGEDTYEKSESQMQYSALNLALSKIRADDKTLDCIAAGDLMNQCTGSAYGLLPFDAPYIGLYGACSTCAESLLVSSLLIESEQFMRCAAVCSSHFCSAERQFRYPLEYGGQRTPTSQWTVTGAGAFIVDRNGEGPYITEVLPGRAIDAGITDINNMGAAMAPAAYDTLKRYFTLGGKKPSDFSLIVTGDLGYEGHSILLDLMKKDGIDMSGVLRDCGLMVYERQRQDMHAGGSGCGCSAVTLAAKILPEIKSGTQSDVLFISTGAMMSPASVQQGNSIPGIAHLIHISNKR